MTDARKISPGLRRPAEIGRRIIGAVLELAIKAYGTAAALSVALSDGETLGGKLYDGLAAVPNLTERYRQAKYVFDHRAEIQDALEYVHEHAPDTWQLEKAAQKSYEALEGVRTVFGEIDQAKAALASALEFPAGFVELFLEGAEHLGRAWEAMPDLEAITHLADTAESVTPLLAYLNNLEIDFAGLYGGLLCVVDNFARDELAGTLIAIGVVLGLSFVLGLGAGFWGRRGRPGIVAKTLQGWGARHFGKWYARHLEDVLGQALYAVARERIQAEVVADPEKALDPAALHELERHFERKLREKAVAVAS